MNTPKTRKPKRYHIDPKTPSRPDGRYAAGLWNDHYALMIGRIATYWPTIEDAMIGILEDLMGGKGAPARQIFRSIVSNQARRKIMMALLERTKLNRDKDSFYDDVLDEFTKLNGKRNDYIHGMWYTRAPFDETAEVYLSEESVDDHHWLEARAVPLSEIHNILVRMNRLNTNIRLRHKRPKNGEQPPPSLDIRLQRHGEETI